MEATASSKFIFDDELVVCGDRQSINGYLWAVDFLVDKLPASKKMKNINFYADYNVLTSDIKVYAVFYVPDTQVKTGERHEEFFVDLTHQEKYELIETMQAYCQKNYSRSCLDFVNEIQKDENLPFISDSLNNIIQKANELKSNSESNNQSHNIDIEI